SRQRRKGLKRLQASRFSVICKHRNGGFHFSFYRNDVRGGMKRKMPRSGPGRQCREWWIVRGENAFGRIETIDKDLVQPEICRQREAVVRRWRNEMRMRARLTSRIHAFAMMLI